MDRNLILAVALSVAVYAAWFGFIEKKVNPQPLKPAGFAASVNSVNAANPPAASNSGSAAVPAASTPKLELSAAEEVELGDAIAKIHPRGAAIISYQYPEP
ncbi:hypothetical protein OY671_010840, partial [Metschnikowia pulcherrima]